MTQILWLYHFSQRYKGFWSKTKIFSNDDTVTTRYPQRK